MTDESLSLNRLSKSWLSTCPREADVSGTAGSRFVTPVVACAVDCSLLAGWGPPPSGALAADSRDPGFSFSKALAEAPVPSPTEMCFC